MSAHRAATPYRWTDADGAALPLLCRVEQIKACPQAGATPARLRQRGYVVGWDTTWLHVCFEPDHAFVVLRAHLVRALNPDQSRDPA
jgi:hypothetical protein